MMFDMERVYKKEFGYNFGEDVAVKEETQIDFYFKKYQPMLFYSHYNETNKVSYKHQELRDLIIRRNVISLTKIIGKCGCAEIYPCAIYNKIKEMDDNHYLKKVLKDIEQLADVYHKMNKYTFNGECIKFKTYTNKLKKGDPVTFYTKRRNEICKGIITEIDNYTIVVELINKAELSSEMFYSTEDSTLFIKYVNYSLLNVAFYMYKKADKFIMPGQENLLKNHPTNTFTQKEIETSHINMNSSKLIETDEIDNFNFTLTENKIKKDKLKSIPIPNLYRSEFLELNEFQQKALINALNTNDFRIIHGMPGTGKSTLIALLIKILVYYGKKVLMICYTHLAIDNLVSKLRDLRIYRCGTKENTKNIHYNSQQMDRDEMKKYFNSFDVVAGTCYSFYDAIYTNRYFDFCIMDEGSQINLLLNLIPLSRCDKFVIVGDHLQISPIKGSNNILGLTLFEHLYNNYECDELKIQYRMEYDIMRISNKMFYKDKMIKYLENSCSKEKCVYFLDTSIDSIDNYINAIEDKATILCYFNSSADKIEASNYKNKKVFTIDRFQGSEDDVVIVVFDPVIQNLCQCEPKRLNVAITRARKKMYLIGNRGDMEQSLLFKELLELI